MGSYNLSNFKWVRSPARLSEDGAERIQDVKWATFGRQNWRWGMNQTPDVNVHETP